MATEDPASRLLDLLDRSDVALRRAVLEALEAARRAGSLEEIEALILSGRLSEALELASRTGALRVAEAYAAVFTLAGREGAAFLSEALEVLVSFDQVNERAVQAIRRERFRLVTEFTEGQRRATRLAILDGVRRGLNPREQARNFRQSIGLTERQQLAVMRYRELLERGSAEALQRELRDRRFDPTVRRAIRTGVPLTQEQVDRMVERYAQRYLRFRAEVIARTEALAAVHSGNHELYLQAVADGTMDLDDVLRTWVDSGDGRVRSSHANLNGMKRRLDETFPGAAGPLRFPGDPLAAAEERIQCRCAVTTRIGSA